MDQDSRQKTDKQNGLAAKCRARIVEALGGNLPELAFVLGSGFQSVVEGFETLRQASFSSLPGFPVPRVRGHGGALIVAKLAGTPCLLCTGRAHYYEGHSMESVTFPVRMLAEMGVKELVLTNAAGGINPKYKPGEFMLLTDHINLMGINPLRGHESPTRFVDLTRAYSPRLRRELLMAAKRSGVKTHTGVYVGVCGPTYETPAEIRAFRALGADAVGMSTIPEALMARACGMETAAISCITNPAAGMRRNELSHDEVLRKGKESAANALRLLTEFARARAKHSEATRPGGARRNNLNNGSPPVGSPRRKR